MKEYPPAEIDGARNFFVNKQYPVEESFVGETKVSYWLLPQGLNPQLPDFALRMTITDPATQEVSGIFGVSDSVSEALRPYWAAHEVIEFMQIGINQQGRCAAAEKQVVEAVPAELKDAFIARRAEFFANLIPYFQADEKNYTADDVKEAESALAFLQGLSDPQTA